MSPKIEGEKNGNIELEWHVSISLKAAKPLAREDKGVRQFNAVR